MILQLSSTGLCFFFNTEKPNCKWNLQRKGDKKYFVFLIDSSPNSTWIPNAKLSYTLLNLITHIKASIDELR